MQRIGNWTAHSIEASSFNWAYAPTIAVSHNPDWGHYMETLGDQPSVMPTPMLLVYKP